MAARKDSGLKAKPVVEKQFASLVRAATYAILGVNHQGKITIWNAAATRMFGYTAKQAIGRSLHDLLVPRHMLVKANKGFKGFVSTGKGPLVGKTTEIMALHKDGYEFPVELSISSFRENGYYYATSIIRDITDRKREEAQLKLGKFSMDHMVDAALWIDRNANIIQANETACKKLGYSRKVLLSMTVSDIDPNYPKKAWTKLWKVLKRQGSHRLESSYRRKTGSIFPVEIMANHLDFEGQEYIFAVATDITKRKQSEKALWESESKHRSLVESTSAIPWKMDLVTWRYTYLGHQVEQLLGYPQASWTDFDTWAERIHPEDREETVRFCREAIERGKDHIIIYRAIAADGAVFWIRDVISVLAGVQGTKELIGFMFDITKEKLAEEKLRKRELQLAAVIDHAVDGIITINESGIIVQFNTSAEGIFGYRPSEVIGQNVRVLMPEPDSSQHDSYIRHYLDTGEAKIIGIGREVTAKRKDGSTFPMELLINEMVLDEKRWFVGVVRDITKRKEAEELIRHQANYDALTDLPNRVLAQDRMQRGLILAKRDKEKLALIYFALDKFKNINGTLGHKRGDMILVVLANRLKECVRESDTVARLGGDEFLIILKNIGSIFNVENIARKIMHTISEQLIVDGHEVFLKASLGLSVYPDDGKTSEELLRYAETAMHRAKTEGGNNRQYFEVNMHKKLAKRMAMEPHLYRALDQDEMEVHFQPVVDTFSTTIVSSEALLRWKNPELGMVSPEKFIPLAEDTGLIVPIGAWVLSRACKQAKLWQEQGLGPIHVAVNISTRQFREEGFIKTVSRILQESGLPSDCLEFEITEGLLLKDVPETSVTLNKLSEMGVRLSLDDFGTGYSSLSYLKRFPFDFLKIDQSFIRDMMHVPKDASLVKAIIAMAHNLGLQVIAEGVETNDQLEFLRAEGCDLIQGYYFSKPLPEGKFIQWCKKRSTSAKGH